MPPTLFILARDNDSDIIKIVVGVIFLALWGLGALISAWNKKAEQERLRRQQGQLPKGLSQQFYAKQAQAPQQPQYAYPVAPPPPPPAQRGKKRRKSSIAAPPVPAGPPPAPVPVATSQPATPTAPTQEVARVARLVHRPESLRAAFILSEVLSPPITLR